MCPQNEQEVVQRKPEAKELKIFGTVLGTYSGGWEEFDEMVHGYMDVEFNEFYEKLFGVKYTAIVTVSYFAGALQIEKITNGNSYTAEYKADGPIAFSFSKKIRR